MLCTIERLKWMRKTQLLLGELFIFAFVFLQICTRVGIIVTQETTKVYIKRHGPSFRNRFSNSHISCQTEFLRCFSHRITALTSSNVLAIVLHLSEIIIKKNNNNHHWNHCATFVLFNTNNIIIYIRYHFSISP